MAEDPSVVYFPCCRIETVPTSGMYMHACFLFSGWQAQAPVCTVWLAFLCLWICLDLMLQIQCLILGCALLSFQPEKFLGWVCAHFPIICLFLNAHFVTSPLLRTKKNNQVHLMSLGHSDCWKKVGQVRTKSCDCPTSSVLASVWRLTGELELSRQGRSVTRTNTHD